METKFILELSSQYGTYNIEHYESHSPVKIVLYESSVRSVATAYYNMLLFRLKAGEYFKMEPIESNENRTKTVFVAVKQVYNYLGE